MNTINNNFDMPDLSLIADEVYYLTQSLGNEEAAQLRSVVQGLLGFALTLVPDAEMENGSDKDRESSTLWVLGNEYFVLHFTGSRYEFYGATGYLDEDGKYECQWHYQPAKAVTAAKAKEKLMDQLLVEWFGV